MSLSFDADVGLREVDPPGLQWMRVVTWNVWGRFGPWRERAPRIATALEAMRPDVLCLQEVWKSDSTTHADVLAERLGLHAVFCRTRMPDDETSSGTSLLGIAILSRWPPAHVYEHPLPDGGQGMDPRGPSVALQVDLDHPAGSLHVVTACPDWDADRTPARQAQLRALARLMGDPALDGPLPVILAADLNADPQTSGFQALTETLTDTWAVTHHRDEPGATFTPRNRYVPGDHWLSGGRIDHVLVRQGTAHARLEIDATSLLGTEDPPPSDHYGVVADLRW